MGYYDRLTDLPLVVAAEERPRHERDTSSGLVRTTTVVSLTGAGETGRGEDVTYVTPDHEALSHVGQLAPTGEFTVDSFSAILDDAICFPRRRSVNPPATTAGGPTRARHSASRSGKQTPILGRLWG